MLALTPPTQNSDGSALTDLAGMRVYYGTSASSLNQVLDLPGAAPTTYALSNLASGTWYFAATAYTSSRAGKRSLGHRQQEHPLASAAPCALSASVPVAGGRAP